MSSFNVSNRNGSSYNPYPSTSPPDNRAADSRNIMRLLQAADRNRDGKWTKAEVDGAMQNAARSGDKRSTEALGTFLKGGRDGGGLFPDFNGDGAIDRGELRNLASADGNVGNLSRQDFLAKFPGRAGNGNQFNPRGNQTRPPRNPYGQQGNNQNVHQFLGLLLQLVLPLMSGHQGGGNGGYNPRDYGYPI